MTESFYCFASLPSFGITNVLHFGHFNRYIVEFHFVLICNTLRTGDAEQIFICLFAIFFSFFSEVPVQAFCLFLNKAICFLLLSLKSTLHIMDNSYLSHIYFSSIHSLSMACL